MPDADINAYYDGFISITPIDGDWTASSQVMDDLGQRLSGIVR
jgi:broad specificity polyphosphatase/5'/3'-nucleotidase SurE